MKRNIIFLIGIMIIGISCNRNTNKDYSLSVEEYQDMGVPDPNMIWDSNEISVAINVFSGIKWDKPYNLPRKGSKRSGMLFDRMVSLENMQFMQNDTLKHHDKAYALLRFLEIFEGWKDVYTHPMWKRQYYQRELVEINVNTVRVTEVMVALTKKIEVSDDPVDIRLQSGIPQVKRNYVSSVVNAMNLQSYTSQFFEKDLELMADSLSASLLRNKSRLDSMSLVQLKTSIDVVLDSTRSEYVTKKYNMLKNLL